MGTTLTLFGQAVNQQLCSERQRLTSPVNPSSESAASAYRAAFAQTDVDISGDGEREPIGLCSARIMLVFSGPTDYLSWRMSVQMRLDLSAWALLFLAALSFSAASESSGTKLMSVSRANLCVTEGVIEELPGARLSVSVPKMRAYLNALTPQFVEAHFTYLGSTGSEARLGSGELRRQFGLKLRAQDSCNLVYAMWRIEPESKLVVSVKSNPGQHTSAQVPALRSGETHTLRAEMNGAEMLVFVDNTLVWEGSVGPDALAFDGPVGIRSDNARLQIELRAGQPLEAQRGHAPGCRSGGEESE